jgi:phosphoglycolate phosphatase
MRASTKTALVVLDFDGFIVNSYELLRATFDDYGIDVGDESRFRNRRKFLKYLGGGREFLGNLVSYSLPRRKKVRQRLTEQYVGQGRVYPEFVPLIDALMDSALVHVGIVSRNFTLNPGPTMRAVLRNSGIDDHRLDFLIPVPVGGDKREVLAAMRSPAYEISLFGADEVGDYRSAVDTGYWPVMASYGFDTAERLVTKAGVPPEDLFDTPAEVARQIGKRLGARLRG